MHALNRKTINNLGHRLLQKSVSAPAGRNWSAPTTTTKKVLILTMKLWKMKKK
jgi:hypothetical protein